MVAIVMVAITMNYDDDSYRVVCIKSFKIPFNVLHFTLYTLVHFSTLYHILSLFVESFAKTRKTKWSS